MMVLHMEEDQVGDLGLLACRPILVCSFYAPCLLGTLKHVPGVVS